MEHTVDLNVHQDQEFTLLSIKKKNPAYRIILLEIKKEMLWGRLKNFKCFLFSPDFCLNHTDLLFLYKAGFGGVVLKADQF